MSGIFAQPKWLWKKAYEHKRYAMVDNEVVITDLRDKTKIAYVVIPSDFFLLLDTILTERDRVLAVKNGVRLYLDQVDMGHWILSFEIADAGLWDLWAYTSSNLPVWA